MEGSPAKSEVYVAGLGNSEDEEDEDMDKIPNGEDKPPKTEL